MCEGVIEEVKGLGKTVTLESSGDTALDSQDNRINIKIIYALISSHFQGCSQDEKYRSIITTTYKK